MAFVSEVKLAGGAIRNFTTETEPEVDGHNNLIFRLDGEAGVVAYAAGNWQSLVIKPGKEENGATT